MSEVCECCGMSPCKHASVHDNSGPFKALVPKEKYHQAMKDWSADVIKKNERIVELERALKIAERRNGDRSDIMDASQEAQHYDFLDQKNHELQQHIFSLESDLTAARKQVGEALEVIGFYADPDNFNIEGAPEGWEDDCYTVEQESTIPTEHGDKARQFLAGVKK